MGRRGWGEPARGAAAHRGGRAGRGERRGEGGGVEGSELAVATLPAARASWRATASTGVRARREGIEPHRRQQERPPGMGEGWVVGWGLEGGDTTHHPIPKRSSSSCCGPPGTITPPETPPHTHTPGRAASADTASRCTEGPGSPKSSPPAPGGVEQPQPRVSEAPRSPRAQHAALQRSSPRPKRSARRCQGPCGRGETTPGLSPVRRGSGGTRRRQTNGSGFSLPPRL